MSQLEVDKIIPQSGTTLTIGDSGDTITFGTGTTPQLGGNLDLNSNDITGTGNINITGNITASGNLAGTLTTASQPNITSVGTLTSATVSGDLTVDTNTLYVDSTNNNVGIKESSPSEPLEVSRLGGSKFSFPTLDGDTTAFFHCGGGSSTSGSKIALGSGNQGFGGIIFADTDDADVGEIEYDHSDNHLHFRVNASERMRIDSSGNVGIGTSSPVQLLHLRSNTPAIEFDDSAFSTIRGRIYSNEGNLLLEADYNNGRNGSNIAFNVDGSEAMRIDDSGNVGIGTSSPDSPLEIASQVSDRSARFTRTASGQTFDIVQDGGQNRISSSGKNFVISSDTTHEMIFRTDDAERMRIDSSGNVLVGTTLTDVHNQNSDVGVVIEPDRIEIAKDNSPPLLVNRINADGDIINFYGQGIFEGSISVSGTTVSYNGFTGTHWSRLADNSKPTILKGTILESLDEMMDWYQIEFDFIKTDDEGNETTIRRKESYTLGENESVGDVITYTYKGTDYQATIIQEGEIKHTKSKISDTVDAKNVYGLFVSWDNDDDTVNDMYVAQTGTFVVRINGSETVSKGDLIQSNGDGTGKVQADDIIRASTVAKVLSTTKIETYDDGSYIVPCSLHC